MKPVSHLGHVARMSAFLLFTIGIVALFGTGCRRGMPVIDPSPGVTNANGTISGTVRGPEGAGSIEGRQVEVVNVDTGEVQRTTTSNVGGFTFKVPPGRYRVQVALLEGERVLKGPGVMNVNRSDVDAHADFIIGSARLLRRSQPQQRDPALGQPTA